MARLQHVAAVELNSIHCSAVRPWQFVVAGSDEAVRVYDRRGAATASLATPVRPLRHALPAVQCLLGSAARAAVNPAGLPDRSVCSSTVSVSRSGSYEGSLEIRIFGGETCPVPMRCKAPAPKHH